MNIEKRFCGKNGGGGAWSDERPYADWRRPKMMIAPNRVQPPGQSEVWLSIQLVKGLGSENTGPKYTDILQSAGVSQSQYESLLAEMQGCMDANSLPTWYIKCSCMCRAISTHKSCTVYCKPNG